VTSVNKVYTSPGKIPVGRLSTTPAVRQPARRTAASTSNPDPHLSRATPRSGNQRRGTDPADVRDRHEHEPAADLRPEVPLPPRRWRVDTAGQPAGERTGPPARRAVPVRTGNLNTECKRRRMKPWAFWCRRPSVAQPPPVREAAMTAPRRARYPSRQPRPQTGQAWREPSHAIGQPAGSAGSGLRVRPD
jgi:hypothetical protein